MADIKIKVGADLDKQSIDRVASQLQEAKKLLEHRIRIDGDDLFDEKDVLNQINKISRALEYSFNDSLGRLDTSQFKKSMKEMEIDVVGFGGKLKDVSDIDLTNNFKNLTQEIKRAEVQIKHTKNSLDKAFDTVLKTGYWSLANNAVQAIGDSVQKAVSYTKNLDESLNNIRVVTGLSSTEMEKFSKTANSTAKELGRTTMDYTEGALLYLQQGKSMEESAELTKQTLIAANITGQDSAETAELLTASLNGYNLAAKDAAMVTDIFANVGAKSGADFRELATGFSRVAAMASTVGVSFEQLTSQIATISTVTREAPESIGNALKTVYARMSQIKLSGSATDEDGITMSYGKVEQALNSIGLTVEDEKGNMKEMGEVIEDVGNKWETLTTKQKSAVTEALAGTRQANKLISLFNQWPMYLEQLENAENSAGAAAKQNEVRMDSLEAKSNKLRATLEELYSKLEIDTVLEGGISAITTLIEKVNELIDSLGGIKGVLAVVGASMVGIFGKQITQTIAGARDGLLDMGKRVAAQTGNKRLASATGLPEEDMAEYAKQSRAAKNLSPQEFEKYKNASKKQSSLTSDVKAAEGKLAEEKETLKVLEKKKELLSKEVFTNSQNVAKIREELKLENDKLKAQKQSLEMTKEELALNSKDPKLVQSKKDKTKRVNSSQKNVDKLKEQLAEAKKAEREAESAHVKAGTEYDNKSKEISKDGEENLKRLREELQETGEEVGEFDKKIEFLNKGKNILGIGAGVATAVVGVTNALEGYKKGAMDFDAQTNAINSGMNSLAAGLFMMPGLWGKVAGGIVLAASAATKWIRENTGIGAVIKQNEKLLENYTKTLGDLETQQDNLSKATANLSRIEELRENGVNMEEQEEYNALVEDAAALEPKIVAYYDAFGNAVLKSREEIDAMNKSLDEQIKKTKTNMSANAGGFIAESAYMRTQGLERKDEIQADITNLENELNKLYDEGASFKKIESVKETLNEYYVEMGDLQTKFDELGERIQIAVVDPFITGEDVFKDMGTELQGFVGTIFNSDMIQKGLDDLSKDGKLTTAQLKRASEDYITAYKNGVLSVGEAFANLNAQASSGDAVASQLMGNLSQLPSDIQKTIAKQTMLLSFGFDQQKLNEEVLNLAQFFDEKTQELDAFGMVEYFHETAGPAARDALYNNIVAGITEGLQAAKLAGLFTEKSFGFFGDTLAENLASQLSGMLDADIVKLSEAQYSDALREDTKSLIQALEEGNLEMMNTLLTSNSDLFALFEEALADESQFDGFLSNFKNDAYKEIATNLNSAMQPIGTEIEQIEELNLVLGEQDVIVANIANSMADSIEGQQEMAELWNGMVEASSNVGEGGLFSIDADALGQSVEALEQVAYNMDEVQGRTEGTAEAFASLEEAQKEASEGAKAVGSAFDTMMESMGETDFERLIKLTGSTQDEIMSLAAQAKDGSIDAAKTLQNEMAKIYAAMNKDNEDYYRSFSKLNADKMNLIAKATGKQATDFKTLAEYEVHLESWKSDNVLKYVEWQHNTITDALSDQVENMGKAADTTMEYQGKQIDATGRSSAIATLMVARNAAVAAEQAGEGGGEAAANMIEAMGSVDEAAGVALNVVADNIRAKGDNFAGIIDYIDRQIAILQEGSEGTADDLKLDGITVPTFDEFKFNAKPGNIAPPTYTKPSGSNAPDDNGGGNDNGSGGGSGGKGGSDKGSGGEPETVEDIEEKLDVYKDVETALSEIAHLMAEQNDLERDLYGQAKIDSIQKRIKLMKEQAKWEQERIRISKAEQDKLRGTLSAQGVKFDSSSGLISNYNSFLQSEIDKVNAIADTNVDAKNAAIERYEALKEQMEEYETHLQAQKSAEEAYLEFQREISQSAIQAIDVKLQIELDKTELERQTEEFLMKVGDGLGSIMDKFLNTAEKVDTTIKLLYGSISDIGALQQKIADIENDPNLTDEDRLNQLKATKQEMIKFYETAMKYRQELEKMQQEAYKDAGKLVSEHLKEFEGINKELKSLLDIIKLTGQMNNTELVGSLMDTQINTTRNQLDAAIKSRDMFASKLANLEEGSEQWKIMNAEVQKLDEQILKLTNESIKLYQEQLKYTVDNVMKDLESALTNNNSFSKVDAALKKQNWEKKEYLSTTEKILSISKLQQKIEEEIQKTTDPAKQKQLQDFLENEVGLLKEKDKLTHYDMERAEKMLEITMKQIALDNARNNKTMMRLVRTSTGNWAYQYVADAEAVEQAQSDLSDSLADLLEFDQKRQEEVQKEMLEQKKAFYKQLEEIMKAALNGEYETQEEFNKAIEDAEKEFNMVMEDLNISLNTANQNLSESTLAAILDAYRNNHGEIGVLTKEQEEFFKNLADSTTDIWGTVRDFLDTVNSDNADSFKDKYADLVAGDADDLFNSLQDTFGDISSEWDNSVSDMITSNDNLTLDTNTAIESIKDAWSDYQDNLKSVTEQAGLDLDGMKDKIDQLGDEQDILAGKTDSLIGSIENELDALQDLAGDLDKVYDAYDKLMDKVDEYMRQLDDLIRKQQDAMNPVTPTTPTVKPPTTSGSTSGSTGGSTGGSSSGSGFSSSLTKGGKARVKSGRTWYHDTDGTNPSGPTTPYANRDLYIVNTTNKKYPYAVGSTTNISSALGWLRKEDLVGFDTGGYTGDWGHNDGKMAMLHEKELVLNKEDTSNILDIVKITREMAATSANLNNLGTLGRNSQGDIKQQVTINAEFPNVSAASEIEKAFANMGNQASQYALERGRIR